MLRTKETHQSAKCQTFNCSHEISPNLYFHKLLLLKACKISAKRVMLEDLCLMTLKSNAKFEAKLICFKMKRILWILIWALKILKISTLIGSFFAKYVTFDLKKYRGVVFHDTEEWCKSWKNTNLRFGKWHKEYDKFSPEHLKISKLGF